MKYIYKREREKKGGRRRIFSAYKRRMRWRRKKKMESFIEILPSLRLKHTILNIYKLGDKFQTSSPSSFYSLSPRWTTWQYRRSRVVSLSSPHVMSHLSYHQAETLPLASSFLFYVVKKKKKEKKQQQHKRRSGDLLLLIDGIKRRGKRFRFSLTPEEEKT